jgi:hypothetical protein
VCNQEQKEIETKITIAGSSERKREKVLSSIDKGSFLDRLKENDEINEDLDTSSIKDQVRKDLAYIFLFDFMVYKTF